MSLSESRAIWFVRTSGISQPILTFPLIGYVSAYQAIIIVAIGIPAMFLTMTYTSQVYYGLIPLVLMVVFAMIRPPVISYEGRLLAILSFYISGNKTAKKPKKRKSKKKTPRALELPTSPSKRRAKATPSKTSRPVKPVGPDRMTMHVRPGGLAEISITLRDRDGRRMPRHKVGIIFDGTELGTDRSSSSGEIAITLASDECIGTKRVVIVDTAGDGSTIAEKLITFERSV